VTADESSSARDEKLLSCYIHSETYSTPVLPNTTFVKPLSRNPH
jgi:hypothetical protein